MIKTKLYHVSRYAAKDKTFIPRIPSYRAFNENNTIPRICTSTSIEGCLNGIPQIKSYADNVREARRVFKVFEFNIDKNKKSNIITSDKLKDEIPDIDITDEHWLTSKTIADKMYYISYISGRNENNLNSFDILYQKSILKINESFDIILNDIEEVNLLNNLIKKYRLENKVACIVEVDSYFEDDLVAEIYAINAVDITLLVDDFLKKVGL